MGFSLYPVCHVFGVIFFHLAFVQPCWRDFLGVASHDARQHNLTTNSLYSGSYILPTPCSAGSVSLGYRGCFIDVSFVTGLYNSVF